MTQRRPQPDPHPQRRGLAGSASSVALAPGHGADGGRLYWHAGCRALRAKARGKTGFAVYGGRTVDRRRDSEMPTWRVSLSEREAGARWGAPVLTSCEIRVLQVFI